MKQIHVLKRIVVTNFAVMLSVIFLTAGNPGLLLAKEANASMSVSQSQAINLNKASAAELEEIKGIGPSMASRIIEHRESKGPFKSVEELREVKGIGQVKLAKIKDSLTV